MTAPFVWITGPLNTIRDFDAQYWAAERLEKAGVHATWFASRSADISEQFIGEDVAYCAPDVWLNPLLGDRPAGYEDWARQYGYAEDYDYDEDEALEGRDAWYARPLTDVFPLTDDQQGDVLANIKDSLNAGNYSAVFIVRDDAADTWPVMWALEKTIIEALGYPTFTSFDALVAHLGRCEP